MFQANVILHSGKAPRMQYQDESKFLESRKLHTEWLGHWKWWTKMTNAKMHYCFRFVHIWQRRKPYTITVRTYTSIAVLYFQNFTHMFISSLHILNIFLCLKTQYGSNTFYLIIVSKHSRCFPFHSVLHPTECTSKPALQLDFSCPLSIQVSTHFSCTVPYWPMLTKIHCKLEIIIYNVTDLQFLHFKTVKLNQYHDFQ